MNKDIKVCSIGGGSGMPIVNKALVEVGLENISSIVTTFDSGGDSGRMKTDERGKLLAFSDYWRSLISLWKDGEQKEEWEEMLKFRDGRGRNFGNIFFQFMSEVCGDLSKVDSLFSKLTRAELKGQVIPVSLDPSNLCFETISGKIFSGEHLLDEHRMSKDSIKKVWLSDKVRGNPEAIEVIKKSDVIIVSPGSMYGSVLINFLPDGIAEAFVKSKAKKILITNIMSSLSENDGFDQNDYIKVFSKYLGVNRPFDLVIMADVNKMKLKLKDKILKCYQFEHSYPIKYRKKSRTETLFLDLIGIDEVNLRLRHSEGKLAKLFLKIL